jgi:hypothetical protein
MLKIMIRGDLLIYTNNGIKRIDKLTKADYIYTNNKTFVEIDEINKINVKNYYLYKIKTFYNIDNYYLGGTNKIYCIQNIPYDIKIKDCQSFVENNTRICLPTFINTSDLTEFDYIGFPYNNDNNDNNNDNDNNDNNYRFQGLVLMKQTTFNLNNNLNKATIDFLISYLDKNEIRYEMFNNNITTTIKFNLDDIKLLTMTEINNLNYNQVKMLIKGFEELNSTISTTEKSLFFQLKNIYFKVGILLSANYMNNNYVIKIPPQTETNYFIYNNYIWFKIKKIVKTQVNYNGPLLSLKLKNNDKFLSEIGFIS